MRQSVHGQVEAAVAAGAALRCGGEVPAGDGTFYPATVLTGCTPDMAVMREETFGPVAPVMVHSDFDSALAAACGGPYGLAAVVLTGLLAVLRVSDLGRQVRVLEDPQAAVAITSEDDRPAIAHEGHGAGGHH